MAIDGIGGAATQALKAYAAAAKRAQTAEAPAAGTAPRFEAVLKGQLADVGAKLEASELKSIEALSGRADLRQVVEAVTAAELGLQKVTAVRDRVIAAYQEIMRMPI